MSESSLSSLLGPGMITTGILHAIQWPAAQEGQQTGRAFRNSMPLILRD